MMMMVRGGNAALIVGRRVIAGVCGHSTRGLGTLHRGGSFLSPTGSMGRDGGRKMHMEGFSARSRLQNVLITTPIFYVNSEPHIGHLYTVLLADALARWHRVLGHPTRFTTGTDEHGLKVRKAALEKGVEVEEFCDLISKSFRELWDRANISYDDYIRTTEWRHIESARNFWLEMEKNGQIYLGHFEGWYSVSDEAFLGDSQVTDEIDVHGNFTGRKISEENGSIVSLLKEPNYIFRLSRWAPKVLEWVKRANPIYPPIFQKEVADDITQNLGDLSVSRLKSKIEWGISVPNDPNHVIYVWLDALVNYLTACGYPNWNDENRKYWPAAYHVIGKDIIKFHAIYWPAFLMSIDLDPPTKIISHGHWTMEKRKMSKSKGNVINPHDLLDRHGVDPVRFFLLKFGRLSTDGDYSDLELQNSTYAYLADTFGNLIIRCTSEALNPTRQWPIMKDPIDPHLREFINVWTYLPFKVDSLYKKAEFGKAIGLIMERLANINGFFTRSRPWTFIPHKGVPKSRRDDRRLQNIIYMSLEAIRLASLLLYPVIPKMCENVLEFLGIPPNHRNPLEYPLGYKYHVHSLSKHIPKEKIILLEKKKLKRPTTRKPENPHDETSIPATHTTWHQ